ncbi:polyunsaturated fatty acid lipoxygenase ALOX15B-like [Alosa pseudoharengus]|uniref:polyunsaturated fatty acid lipoxygenase ALOX15B-like n=1 Tax=Alosa pseudoharengus TaxID=34774 RepID=UPI003F8C2539
MNTLIYNVQVTTGDRFCAGTFNSVSIRLIGTDGVTEQMKINLNEGLSRDSVRDLKLAVHSRLGSLELVEFEAERFLGIVEDEWFCSRVVVTTPEADVLLFPCYCWVSSQETRVFREASAKFIFQETRSKSLEDREMQLKKCQEEFRWRVYAPGLPQIVSANNALALPPEVRFSFTKETEFHLTLAAAFVPVKLNAMADNRSSWESFHDLDQIFVTKKTKAYEFVRQHWQEDEFFGYQFLNGLNPMMIGKCLELPNNFLVTEDMVKSYLPDGSSLRKEMENGNIFLCDYKDLNCVVGKENVIHDRLQYLAAPLCLLYKTSDKKLLPIAIQLKQEAGEENPIFLPSDNQDWLLAKIFVRNAEFNMHELNFHLLRTHLLAEVFFMATVRQLPSAHPLFKLLVLHFRYTLQINIMARDQLMSEEAFFSEHTGIGLIGSRMFLRKALATLTYSSLCLPENIKVRGLEEIPNFYYRDDGLKLWKIIHEYVEGVLGHYYTSDDYIQRDTELQLWIKDIYKKAFLERQSSEIPQSFTSLEELVKFATMIIFTVSVQHAAVNNGQFDFGAWMPNFPSSLKCPPPTCKGKAKEIDVLETLPDIGTTVHTMTALYLLGQKSSDHYSLGNYPEQLFVEQKPLELTDDFRRKLEVLSYDIKARNVGLPLPYTYLDPENIENSVAI